MSHPFLPNTDETRKVMLKELGLSSVDELFKQSIPDKMRFKGTLDLPKGISELELLKLLNIRAGENKDLTELVSFLGGGVADHYIPAAVDHIISRSEFYTAYTPYQAEASQGTLQSIFEFQSMICQLTGMDIANASMYDGGSAVAEAALMSSAATRKNKILVSKTVNPQYREVLKTYCRASGKEIIELPQVDGTIDLKALEQTLDDSFAAVICQQPNYFGIVEDMFSVDKIIKNAKNVNFICVVEPVSLGILQPPANYGCDIVVGEGQPFGNPLSYGGPHFGFLTTREKLIRQMPGRVIGMTNDKDDNRGFVMTMQTREQHIRREKATSNICSNQALNALAAVVYMSLMGKEGLLEVAEQCLQKANYLKDCLNKTANFKVAFKGANFKEFVVKSLKQPWSLIQSKMLGKGILAGSSLESDYPELANHFLVCVTEKRTKDEIDMFVRELEGI